MNSRVTRFILRADAVFDLVTGAALLAAPSDRLFDAAGVERPAPAPLLQLAGAGSLVFVFVLWRASRDDAQARRAARAAALANAPAALALVGHAFAGRGVTPRGRAVLLTIAAVLAAFAAGEASITVRTLH